MKNILIVIAALVAGLLVLRNRSLHRNDGHGPAEAPASGAPAAHPSPYGFTPVALSGLPADRVVVIAPEHCSSAEGQRADQLTAQLEGEGIPCMRAGSVSLSFDHVPSAAEMAASDAIMRGAAPIIFINGRARNNPGLSDIVSEFRSR